MGDFYDYDYGDLVLAEAAGECAGCVLWALVAAAFYLLLGAVWLVCKAFELMRDAVGGPCAERRAQDGALDRRDSRPRP